MKYELAKSNCAWYVARAANKTNRTLTSGFICWHKTKFTAIARARKRSNTMPENE